MSGFGLAELGAIIAERVRSGDPASSWTTKLHAGGIGGAAKKLGEEAVETVIAAVSDDKAALVAESADMLYHWLVVLSVADIPLRDVMDELERRTTRSGIAEKAARTS